jgi:dTDP-4-dehydrorhamnose reductase
MRILVLGRTGQVGWELNRSLQPLGEVLALSRSEADFSHPETLRKVVRGLHADVIVNAVAYTNVDKAESEKSLAQIINEDGPAILAEEAKRSNALLIHYSTDYVFDGENPEPYIEDDKPNPINAYGQTKLAGERNIQATGCRHLIFRTSWIYSPRGHNFVNTILRLAQQRDQLRIVADQIGAPTSARFIADVTCRILATIRPLGSFLDAETDGIFHLTASNYTTWFGFAQTIIDAKRPQRQGVNKPNLIPISTEQYPLPAQRPRNSRLNCDALRNRFGIYLPEWEIGARLCLDEIIECGS